MNNFSQILETCLQIFVNFRIIFDNVSLQSHFISFFLKVSGLSDEKTSQNDFLLAFIDPAPRN